MEENQQEVKPLKIQISIPSCDKPELECFGSMFHAMQHAMRSSIHQYNLVYGKRMFIHFARKAMVESAIRDKADYILFLDDDMVFQPNAITRLVAAAEKYELDCVSGLYCRRGKPFETFIMIRKGDTDRHFFYMPKPDQRNTLMECDATGLGCCLFKTSVFERVPTPWFELPDNMTEDTYFFKKMNKSGIRCHVDTGITCGHIGTNGIVFPYKTEFSETIACGYHKIYAEEYLLQNGLYEKESDRGADKQEESGKAGESDAIATGEDAA